MKAIAKECTACGMMVSICAAMLLPSRALSQVDNREEEIRKSSEALQKLVTWALPTNGFKMGILAEVVKEGVSHPGEAPVDNSVAFVGWRINTALIGLSTNTLLVALPPRESLADLRLFDPKGKPVAMTATGKRMRRPASMEGKSPFHQGFRRVPVDSEFPRLPGACSYRLLDLFKVAAPGDYTVLIKLRAAAVVSNEWVISEFEVPAFKLPINQR